MAQCATILLQVICSIRLAEYLAAMDSFVQDSCYGFSSCLYNDKGADNFKRSKLVQSVSYSSIIIIIIITIVICFDFFFQRGGIWFCRIVICTFKHVCIVGRNPLHICITYAAYSCSWNTTSDVYKNIFILLTIFWIQFNRGTSVMQHYVGLRPMFDLEIMNADVQVVLGDSGSQSSPSNVGQGLSFLYNEITGMKNSTSSHELGLKYSFWFCYFFLADTVRKEAETITAVFPYPSDVMSILVQVFWFDLFILAFTGPGYHSFLPWYS